MRCNRFWAVALIFLVFFTMAAKAKTIYTTKAPKTIALTFDDGPNLGITDNLLDILKQENVHATFFVIGRKAKQHPDLILRIKAEGHSLGNHTYSHVPITWINNDKVKNELIKTNQILYQITSKEVSIFRPPHGRTSKSKEAFTSKLGFTTVLWTVNADDFYNSKTGMRSADSIVKRVLARVKGRDIILMHDNSQEIVDAMPGIIKGLKKKNYKFVTI